MTGGRPGVAEPLNLLGLKLMERDPGVFSQQCRTHQVHALLSGPFSRLARSSTPPDPVTKPGRVRLYPQQTWRIWEHRPRVGLCEPLAFNHLEKDRSVLPSHRSMVRALSRGIAEVPKPVDHLLR